jgi:hypothetical protein
MKDLAEKSIQSRIDETGHLRSISLFGLIDVLINVNKQSLPKIPEPSKGLLKTLSKLLCITNHFIVNETNSRALLINEGKIEFYMFGYIAKVLSNKLVILDLNDFPELTETLRIANIILSK